ncbi:MAG: GNAT family N-acetyltransferase [Patescibacteria group bacterium]
MKDRKLATSQLREMLTYVARFGHSTFVIAIDGRVLEGNDILSVAGDITLLHAVGIRIVLVLGSSDQSDYRIRRKTRYARLQSLAAQLCRSLNMLHCNFLVSNKPEVTKSQGFAFKVEENDIGTESLPDKVGDILAKGLLPVIVARPKDENTDESWFGSLLRVTTSLCAGISTNKLIYLSCVDGIFQRGSALLREAQPSEVRQLVTDGVITGQFAEFTSMAEQVISTGVLRVHFINGKVIGGLLSEVFTKDGVGTMIHQNPYQEIRSARESDIGGILNVLGTQESRGDVRQHTEEMIGAQLANYRVAVKDDGVMACGCLRCFPSEKKALISSLAVDQSYLSDGIGELMLERLFEEAGGQGVALLTLVSPHTGQWWLSQKFTTGKISDLPLDLQASNSSSAITILVRRLES